MVKLTILVARDPHEIDACPFASLSEENGFSDLTSRVPQVYAVCKRKFRTVERGTIHCETETSERKNMNKKSGHASNKSNKAELRIDILLIT